MKYRKILIKYNAYILQLENQNKSKCKVRFASLYLKRLWEICR